jgi:hypothetical protein
VASFERERLPVRVYLGWRGVAPPRDVPVRLDETALHLGELVVPREEIGQVFVELDRSANVVVEDRRDGARQLIAFAHWADARALLDALERPLERTLVRVPATVNVTGIGLRRVSLRAWMATALVAALGVITSIASSNKNAVTILLMFGFLALTLLVRGRDFVSVGADGVRYRARFYAWRDVASVTAAEDALTLTLRSGDTATIAPHHSERTNDLVARIEAGLAAHRAAAPEEEDARLLRRDARATPERVKKLRDLGRDDQTYRDAYVGRDRLWRIVEDPSHEGGTRATAAVALSGALDDAERRRLRVAAEATVSPKVRVALDEVASSASDARLARALAAIEREEARRRS